jgi:hypothetical protein
LSPCPPLPDARLDTTANSIADELPAEVLATAINDGTLRREIDEAVGWDPELAV